MTTSKKSSDTVLTDAQTPVKKATRKTSANSTVETQKSVEPQTESDAPTIEKTKRGRRKKVVDVAADTASRDIESAPGTDVELTSTKPKRTARKKSSTDKSATQKIDETTTQPVSNAQPTSEQLTAFAELIDADDIADAKLLGACLQRIQDIALQIHEQFELRGLPIIRFFEQAIFGPYRRVSEDTLCSSVWNFALFTRARLVDQQTFQDRVIAALPDAEHTLIMRQLLCNAPKAWSYRRSYQKSFAHTLNGPQKTQEISLRASLSTSGIINTAAHLYALGWNVTFHDKTWFISACELTRDQAFAIEAIHPFPLHRRDEVFWEEMFSEIMQTIFESNSILTPEAARRSVPEQTTYMPEVQFQRVQKLVLRQMYATRSVEMRRAARDIHDVIALCSPAEIVNAAERAVQEFTSTQGDGLRDRLLEAFGCDEKGEMPQASTMILANDPTALLLLDPELPLFSHIHARDPIKTALQYETQNGEDLTVRKAFEQYVAERRWLQTFACFDLNNEEHASAVGLPIDSIKSVFDPRFLDARLSIALQGDYQHQLQEKFGYYTQDCPWPKVREVIDAVMSRRIQRGSAMVPLVQWLFQCCERWRNCLSEIETANQSVRTLDQNSAKMLSNGLKGLAAMFKKKKT